LPDWPKAIGSVDEARVCNRSGGVGVKSNTTTIGGDLVGHDKFRPIGLS